jgi:NADH-ubiquinone oxidoreductase chain 5
MLTVITNRIGDVLIIIGLAILYFNSSLSYVVTARRGSFSALTCVIFFLAAITKSAQIPFSGWLPAAMAAPTPVSRLVHSSTLVTAGVYLLVRFDRALQSLINSGAIALTGTFTMVIAGRAALFQMDLKKLVALSTLSQLGLIVATCGLGLSGLAYAHMLMHAFFKSLLFISTGTIIHSLGGYQDLRRVKLSIFCAPLTSSVSFIRRISLMGLPFIRGFYSKDLILETVFTMPLGVLIFFGFFMGTILTMGYSLRFIARLFPQIRRQTLV